MATESLTLIEEEQGEEEDRSSWGDLAPELLTDVVDRIQRSQGEGRRVVAMAGVCRSWRRQILSFRQQSTGRSQGFGDPAARAPCGLIEFPWKLLQPGPRSPCSPVQCLLTRRGNHFLVHETPANAEEIYGGEMHFLLAARRRWLPTGFSYIIGKDPRHLTDKQGPDALGKLKSNFWASEFVLWEKRDDEDVDDDDHVTKSSIPVVSLRFEEHIVNGIRQRRIQCALPQPCKAGEGLSSVLERRLRNKNPASVRSWLREWSCSSSYTSFKSCSSQTNRRRSRRSSMLEIAATSSGARGVLDESTSSTAPVDVHQNDSESEADRCYPLELRSKVPAWDARQQCWSLDFKGRATMPSMHNFQLVGTDNNTSIVLQLGKINKNIYTMDFGYPLSAFQAFAICLSSFATSAGLEP